MYQYGCTNVIHVHRTIRIKHNEGDEWFGFSPLLQDEHHAKILVIPQNMQT